MLVEHHSVQMTKLVWIKTTSSANARLIAAVINTAMTYYNKVTQNMIQFTCNMYTVASFNYLVHTVNNYRGVPPGNPRSAPPRGGWEAFFSWINKISNMMRHIIMTLIVPSLELRANC